VWGAFIKGEGGGVPPTSSMRGRAPKEKDPDLHQGKNRALFVGLEQNTLLEGEEGEEGDGAYYFWIGGGREKEGRGDTTILF